MHEFCGMCPKCQRLASVLQEWSPAELTRMSRLTWDLPAWVEVMMDHRAERPSDLLAPPFKTVPEYVSALAEDQTFIAGLAGVFKRYIVTPEEMETEQAADAFLAGSQWSPEQIEALYARPLNHPSINRAGPAKPDPLAAARDISREDI